MWTRSDILQSIGIVVSVVIAFGVYGLQRKLTDKQRVDHRLEIEDVIKDQIYNIHYHKRSNKVQLYNAKLLNKKYFTENKRSRIWGYPFHAAELYAENFDGLEFVIGIKEINEKKYYEVGVIPYESILGIKPEGDGSFKGMILYVKPRLIQLDKYSISYKTLRYYSVK